MSRGITVTNYLVTGNPEGIIYSYLSNWTGQAIKIPRNLLVEAKNNLDLQKPGVYLLLGQNPENPDDKIVYVGEANKLIDRLLQHLKDNDKSFFENIVIFSSKDENLTVSHTKYLEQLVISNALKQSEYRLLNKKDGSKINLPQMVKDEMLIFFDNMKIILPTLGFYVLIGDNMNSEKNKNDNIFTLDIGGIVAKAKLTSNGILVLKDSSFNINETNSLSGSYSNLRKTLLEKRIVIKKDSSYYFFTKDFEFTSPSTAAAIILGYSINGRTAWKNKSGKTIKELEEETISD